MQTARIHPFPQAAYIRLPSSPWHTNQRAQAPYTDRLLLLLLMISLQSENDIDIVRYANHRCRPTLMPDFPSEHWLDAFTNATWRKD